MLKPENQKDKERFEKLKETELAHGRGEQEATDIAARETKTLRERDGRSKDQREAQADEIDDAPKPR